MSNLNFIKKEVAAYKALKSADKEQKAKELKEKMEEEKNEIESRLKKLFPEIKFKFRKYYPLQNEYSFNIVDTEYYIRWRICLLNAFPLLYFNQVYYVGSAAHGTKDLIEKISEFEDSEGYERYSKSLK